MGHDAPVAEQPPPKEAPKPPEGFSQFLGKVLDQLSLSAWLPATMLVGCTALLMQLRADGGFDFSKAILNLAQKPWGILIVLLFALVLATMISQAFAFTAIRWLEGYWRGPLMQLGIYRVLVRRMVRRRERLERKSTALEFQTREEAMRAMRADNVPRYLIRIIEDITWPAEDNGCEWTPEQLAEAEAIDYRIYVEPDRLGRLEQVNRAIKDYPEPHQMMPTKLGNILRKTEQAIRREGEDIRGLMLRHGETVGPRLRLHHDQFRTRLDMYCTLVFIQVSLAAITAVLLGTGRNPLLGTAIVTAVFLLLAMASYSAAIASARGYGDTLRAIFVPTKPD